jgi:hypothetical protein
MNVPLLYIDPGTGSMLFSIIIGVTAAVYFVLRALVIKAKVFFAGGAVKQGAKNRFVIYAEDARYWTLFKPIVDEFEKRGTELLYLTSSRDDPVFDENLKHAKAEFIAEGGRAFARLNFLSADLVLSTTPGLDVYQWKRSKTVRHYAHIVHAADEPVKYELFGTDYYDSILVTGGSYQTDDIRKIEKIRSLPEKKIVTVGCPYLDLFAEKMKELPSGENHVFTVLVSPSWGGSSLLVRYGEKLLDPLAKTGWQIIVRPHPQSLKVEKPALDRLADRYGKNPNILWDFRRENIFSLNAADVMISDFSGILLDYMFLRERPVIYAAQAMDLRRWDAHVIYRDQDEMWTFRTLKKTGVELTEEMFNDLPAVVEKTSADTERVSAIREVKAEAWHYQGEAGKRTVDFMMSTVC